MLLAGHMPIRLPFPPGVEYDYMAEPPAHSMPPEWNPNFKIENDALTKAAFILKDKVTGVETVAVAPDGRLGLVDKWGKIFIAEPDGKGGYNLPPEPLAYSSPGRPLGVKFDAEGNLYIANSPLGLLQLVAPGDAEHQKLILATGRVSDDSTLKAGFPVEFANSLDIAQDGTVYFSCSTDVLAYKTEDGSWEALDSVYVTLAKGAPAGMLLAYHPSKGSTIALMNELWFANGVALAHDESYVLVADSIQMKVHRFWLKGKKAGTHDSFIDKLPGPPDGVSRAADGENFWVTIYSDAPGIIAYSNRRLVRLLLAWTPRIMRLIGLQPPKKGLVLKVNGEGQIVKALGDPTGKVLWGVTAATEQDGKLFLGTLKRSGVPVLNLHKAQ
eukprot:GHRR01018025.1.p1 GENE.GHRR01018025.1~~GHRR01018025.1.p1  ORF type:complete len:385 (+),score=107.69 GHRR01018025.1:394-1548(+)